ncbi:hypothetical protein V8F06_003472 [Rhypophila decipiens]
MPCHAMLCWVACCLSLCSPIFLVGQTVVRYVLEPRSSCSCSSVPCLYPRHYSYHHPPPRLTPRLHERERQKTTERRSEDVPQPLPKTSIQVAQRPHGSGLGGDFYDPQCFGRKPCSSALLSSSCLVAWTNTNKVLRMYMARKTSIRYNTFNAH